MARVARCSISPILFWVPAMASTSDLQIENQEYVNSATKALWNKEEVLKYMKLKSLCEGDMLDLVERIVQRGMTTEEGYDFDDVCNRNFSLIFVQAFERGYENAVIVMLEVGRDLRMTT